jgi:hypothetical protein
MHPPDADCKEAGVSAIIRIVELVVAVAQRSRRQVVALKIEGSIPSSHPKYNEKKIPKTKQALNSNFEILSFS